LTNERFTRSAWATKSRLFDAAINFVLLGEKCGFKKQVSIKVNLIEVCQGRGEAVPVIKIFGEGEEVENAIFFDAMPSENTQLLAANFEPSHSTKPEGDKRALCGATMSASVRPLAWIDHFRGLHKGVMIVAG
jgi:hypothetical protein